MFLWQETPSQPAEPSAIPASEEPLQEQVPPAVSVALNDDQKGSTRSQNDFHLLTESSCVPSAEMPDSYNEQYSSWRDSAPDKLWEKDLLAVIERTQPIKEKLEAIASQQDEGKRNYEMYRLMMICRGPYNVKTGDELKQLRSAFDTIAKSASANTIESNEQIYERSRRALEICQGFNAEVEEARSYFEESAALGYLPALFERAHRPGPGPRSDVQKKRKAALAALIENLDPNPHPWLIERIAALRTELALLNTDELLDGLSLYKLAQRLQPTGLVPDNGECGALQKVYIQLTASEQLDVLEKSEEYYVRFYH